MDIYKLLRRMGNKDQIIPDASNQEIEEPVNSSLPVDSQNLINSLISNQRSIPFSPADINSGSPTQGMPQITPDLVNALSTAQQTPNTQMEPQIEPEPIAQIEPEISQVPTIAKPVPVEAQVETPIENQVRDQAITKTPESDDLKALLDRYQNRQRDLGFMRLSSDFAKNVGFKGSDKYLEGEEAGAKLPVENYVTEQAQKGKSIANEQAAMEVAQSKEGNDPTSKLSASMRTIAKTMLSVGGIKGPTISDDMSAAAVQKVLGPLGNLAATKAAQEAKLEMAKIRQEEKATTGKDKAESKNMDWLTRQQELVNKSKEKEHLAKIEGVEGQINSILAKKDRNSADDIAALYNFVKMMDPDSAVREGEIKLAKEGVSAWDNIKMNMSKYGASPRVMTDKFINNMSTLIGSMKEQQKAGYQQRVKSTQDLARRKGIKDEDLGLLDTLHGEVYDGKKSNKVETKTDSKIEEYAKAHSLSYDQAQAILKGRGYGK